MLSFRRYFLLVAWVSRWMFLCGVNYLH